ncbi:hypothetical protein [Hymenobacter sp. HDW8]|uniref:hypothetical protein n=1 Tax=Hymenobacter sp. HDW8 TaxID=2714932 RepID=UPI001408AE3F|nr:hypothetical protein [Hymenobacter sp. HDW8]QIL77571.1 hypothetical protein G7064_18280 [Hymenobacter sp. HDW8]
MAYYIRVLGKTDPDIKLESLVQALNENDLSAKFSLDRSEKPDNWTLLNVADGHGKELMQIERNPIIPGELGQEELDEFKEKIKSHNPATAAKWLINYFDSVKVIYAFQLLNSVEDDNDWEIVNAIRMAIWTATGGILQADAEGFSNESGCQILWQFNDDAEGEYNMAVLNGDTWVNFIMNLEDTKQRFEFWEGQVPKGAKLLD